MDIHHEDLKEKIWTNKEEEKGLPGVDDDGNGYIDDVHGWNFLGSKDGKNIKSSTLEVTREYVKYKKKKETSGLTPEEEIYFEKVRTDYLTSKNDNFMNLLIAFGS